MKLAGNFQADVLGTGSVRPVRGGMGHGGTPLPAGHLRVIGQLDGRLAFYGLNPEPDWQGWLTEATPDAETVARAEEARRQHVAGILARDTAIRAAEPMLAGTVVHLAKGTTYDRSPEGAVAFVGGRASSHLVWLGVAADGGWYPISGVRARQDRTVCWAEALSPEAVRRHFEEASLLDVRREAKGATEVLFGTCAVR